MSEFNSSLHIPLSHRNGYLLSNIHLDGVLIWDSLLHDRKVRAYQLLLMLCYSLNVHQHPLTSLSNGAYLVVMSGKCHKKIPKGAIP